MQTNHNATGGNVECVQLKLPFVNLTHPRVLELFIALRDQEGRAFWFFSPTHAKPVLVLVVDASN